MERSKFTPAAGRGRGLIVLAGLAAVAVLLVACDVFPADGGIEFPPIGAIYINYNNERTVVDPVTLLAEGGGPLNGYTWSLASGSSFPAGTTVDPLTGVFKPTGGTVSHTPTTFRMTVTAGSNTAISPPYSVVMMNYGSGLVPTAILQQWPPEVDPSALQLMDAEPGKAYGASLYVLGGTPPYRWMVNTIFSNDLGNAGLSVSPTTGVVIGTPFSSASGQILRFKVVVTDARGDTAIFEPVYSIRVK
ncbi:MAG: Ig domain-containing protein [bacterium]